MLAILISLLPVLYFLVVLFLFDSFKLVPHRTLAQALLAGAAVAGVTLVLHTWLFDVTAVGPARFSRYVAPITEETLKTLVVVYFLRRGRMGFIVDAAIIGFAIGAGFAVVENIGYLSAVNDPRIWLWIVRGFGTAILLATTTAIVATMAKALTDAYPRRRLLTLVPGWAVAVALHSLFNHALVSPVLAAALLVLVLPLVVLVVFQQSERKTREWIGEGLDLDVELLKLMRSSFFGDTRLGRYLEELKSRLPGPVVADMFCLLQIDLELAIRARGMLMAREAGVVLPPDPDLRARLKERAYLRRSIGRTGMLALGPLLGKHDPDLWHRHVLEQGSKDLGGPFFRKREKGPPRS